jgi:hypothetical protein
MADPMQFFNSPPNFNPSATATGRADSGVSGISFKSGDFTVGGMKNNWILILAGVAVLYIIYKKK